MQQIDWLRTALVILVSAGGIIAAYFKTIHQLEHKFRDKFEEQLKQVTELKVEIEKLKGRDDMQQQFIDQLKKHVLDNLPAYYQAIENKSKKND